MRNNKTLNRREILKFTSKITLATIAASQGVYLVGAAVSKAGSVNAEAQGLKACIPCFCCSAFQCLACPPGSTPYCGPTDPCIP